MNWTETVGYLASLVVLLSFVMKDLRKLRILNLLGCLMFVMYGVLLHYSFPIILTNVCIIGINIYHLSKEQKQ